MTRAEYIAGAIVNHYKRRRKIDEYFEFPKGTKIATKNEIIALLEKSNFQVSWNQVFKGGKIRNDLNVILLVRGY